MTKEIENWVSKLLISPGQSTLGVCGFGGTGKSTVMRDLSAKFRDSCVVFETDWYMTHSSKERREGIARAIESNIEHELNFWSSPINWYDWQELTNDLSELMAEGQLLRQGFWRSSTGEKDLSISLSLKANAVILVDGIYLLHDPIRSLLDAVIMLEVDVEEALARSIARDKHRSPPSRQEFKKQVAYSHDIPYFEKWRSSIDEIVMFET